MTRLWCRSHRASRSPRRCARSTCRPTSAGRRGRTAVRVARPERPPGLLPAAVGDGPDAVRPGDEVHDHGDEPEAEQAGHQQGSRTRSCPRAARCSSMRRARRRTGRWRRRRAPGRRARPRRPPPSRRSRDGCRPRRVLSSRTRRSRRREVRIGRPGAAGRWARHGRPGVGSPGRPARARRTNGPPPGPFARWGGDRRQRRVVGTRRRTPCRSGT